MNQKQLIKTSITAGIVLSIFIYASVLFLNQYLSAFIISLGILFINLLNINTFTDRAGFILTISDITTIITVMIWNIFGIYIGTVIFKTLPNSNKLFEISSELVRLKLSENIISYFIESILCGMINFLAILSFSKYKNYLTIILPIMMIIICGFEHSLINSFYYIASNKFLISIPYLFINIFGNMLGSALLKKLLYAKKETKK